MFFRKIINIGISGEANLLEKLRGKLINLAFFMVIMGDIFLLISRIIENDPAKILLNLVLLVTLSATFLLCTKGFHQVAVFMMAIFLLLLPYFHTIVDVNISSTYYLLVVPILYSLVSKYIWTRRIILLLAIILYSIIFFESYSDNVPYYVILIIGYLITHNFVTTLEKLSSNLESTVSQKNDLIVQMKNANERMLLFSNAMSHDLRSPINNIEGFAKLLEKDDLAEENKKEYLGYITTYTKTMRRLIDSLLVYAKVKSSESTLAQVDMNQVIEIVLKNLKIDIANKKVNIEHTKLPIIEANENGLIIVFQNLISNAIKYQPLNSLEHTPRILISYKDSEDMHQIFVKDNGIGISEKYQEKIFQAFQRLHSASKYEGTGLGLHITSTIIKNHKGKLSLYQSNDKGSTFLVELPKSFTK